MADQSTPPLKPGSYYILVALANQDRHGSSIQREVLRLTEGHFRLWPTMLYSTLESLQEEGWIEELTDPRQRPAGKSLRRRYYRITEQGRQAMARETERLSGLVETARLRNAHGPEEKA